MSDQRKKESTGLEVAVIGMAGRFPGAPNIKAFWENLKHGVESITFFTDAELEAAGVEREVYESPNYIKAKGILDQIEYFDANLFGYSPKDAQILDPQVRVFYELVWEALEDAGYNPYGYTGLIGLYAGASANYFWEAANLAAVTAATSGGDTPEQFARMQLVDNKFLPTRISYQLNLKGPSIFVYTACSTSLMAVHLACRALLTGECQIALAGGVTLALPQRSGYLYQEGMITSPDGHCRAFDARAGGTVWGEGAGVVVLKMLKNALADGDHIYAVVKGTAINNDGFRKVGYTAPSIEGQAEVIRTAHRVARVEPESIGYIETHGTGTVLGDPIEIEALRIAFGGGKKQYCRIGSVKTNIGHLDSAAGIAGFIKTALALYHRQIPPSLHFQSPNPKIDFVNSPFVVNTQLTDWSRDPDPLRAGVSAFGIGGTNAHVVLEQAPPVPAGPDAGAFRESPVQQLIVFSAKTETALARIAANLAAYLRENPGTNLADFAYTLSVGRAQFPYRRIVVCDHPDHAVRELSKQADAYPATEESPGLVFMFPGEGSQYPNMGRELYETEDVFREEINRCSDLLKPLLNLDIRTVLYPEHVQDSKESPIYRTKLAGPVIFSVEYALAKLLMKWGLKPQRMISYGIGEYVAACLAEVFSPEDALTLVAWRSKLMREKAEEPGETDSDAFHDAVMETVPPQFYEQVKGIQFSFPKIPYITGNWIGPEEAASPEYWIRNIHSTVRFAGGVTKLLESGRAVLVEVGGGGTITGHIEKHPHYRTKDHFVLHTMRNPKEEGSDLRRLFTAIGQLWLRGISLDWNEFYRSKPRRRLSLPAYPFDRKRFWIDEVPPKLAGATRENLSRTDIKKNPIQDWFYAPSWQKCRLFHHHGANVIRNTPADRPTRCLIFLGENHFSIQIVRRMQAEKIKVTMVKPGPAFAESEPGIYSIRPGEAADYQALIQALHRQDQLPEHIIHLWSITKEGAPAGRDLRQISEAGFYSLLNLAKAIGNETSLGKLQLFVVSNKTQKVTGDETIEALKTTILGPCKVIPQEYPQITCRYIDVSLPEPDSPREKRLLEDLRTEFFTDSEANVVAYRGSERWVEVYQRIPPVLYLEQSGDLMENPPFRLKSQGIYLITGGLGRIGMIIARHLAENFQAKLILIGRSPVPDRALWENWLSTHEPNEIISRRIIEIKEMEALGAEVLIFSSDLTSPRQLEAIILQAEQRFGQIQGIIHAAGVLEGKTISEITKTDCENCFQAKITGLLTLSQVFQDRELDFCLLMSSLAATLGGIGFVAYAAANLFMDAFVKEINRKAKTLWISVNWDGWRFSGEPGRHSFGAEIADLAIGPEEGMRVFHQILRLDGIDQVLISTGDLQARIDKWLKREDLKRFDQSGNSANPVMYARPDLPNPYRAPRTETEAKLAEVWQDILGIERIGIEDNYFDLGGNSLKAIEVAELARKRKLYLSVRDILHYRTIAVITENIMITGISEPDNSGHPDPLVQDDPVAHSDPAGHPVPLGHNDPTVDDERGRKVLKVVLQRDVSSYLAYSLPLCIIMAYDNMLPWYYQHFIQISAQIGRASGYIMLDYVEPILRLWDIIRLIQIPYFRLDDGASVLELMKEKISLDYYIFVYVDEYHIPAKTHYQKVHFVHETMIYGYDDQDKKLFAVGFDQNEILSKLEMSYDQFIQAFDSGRLYYKETAPYARYQAVELFRLQVTDDEFPFDKESFLNDFRDYLKSQSRKGIASGMLPPGEPYAALGKLPVVYGLEVYDLVISKLQELLQGKILMDYRAVHLLAEHKKGLYHRLRWVISRYNLAGKTCGTGGADETGKLLAGYEAVAREMEVFRIKFMELVMAGDSSETAMKESLLTRLIEMLIELKKKDEAILTELIPILETKL